jgi:hypothetical protein
MVSYAIDLPRWFSVSGNPIDFVSSISLAIAEKAPTTAVPLV